MGGGRAGGSLRARRREGRAGGRHRSIAAPTGCGRPARGEAVGAAQPCALRGRGEEVTPFPPPCPPVSPAVPSRVPRCTPAVPGVGRAAARDPSPSPRLYPANGACLVPGGVPEESPPGESALSDWGGSDSGGRLSFIAGARLPGVWEGCRCSQDRQGLERSLSRCLTRRHSHLHS